MEGTNVHISQKIEFSEKKPFTSSNETAVNEVQLQSKLLRKMKPNKTKLYQHLDPDQVLKNTFELLYNELLTLAEGNPEVHSRALMLKITHAEALEKLNSQKD